MKNNRYEFNHEAKEIIITKAFAKESSVIGSSAYKELLRLKKDWSDYTIKVREIKKKENKKSFKGLTIKEMRRFLATVGENDLKLFDKACEIAEGKQGKYAIMKKWFLNKYQEAYEKELENLKLVEELASIENEIIGFETEELEDVA